MKCPYCGNNEDKVIDSRAVKNGEAIRRRRECLLCKKRFTTYEGIEYKPIIVIKKDGRREEFSKEKIMNGIKIACQKRPISFNKINEIVEKIYHCLSMSSDSEIASSDIGKMLMDELRKLDKIAYVRFASVYKEFKDMSEFVKEVKDIGKH